MCPSSFVIILMREERAGCFALPVSLVSCDSQCTVALPYYAVGWSAMCDCGISRSYSLVFYEGVSAFISCLR